MQQKTPKNPYPGLRPFEFAENHLFFGREGQSEEILRRLQESRFLAVIGTSGSGKSSLVRAGLLPLLYGGFMTEAGARWQVALFRPGDNPIHNLADALVHPAQFSLLKTAKPENAPEEQDLKFITTETVLRRSAVGLRDYADGSEFAADENLLIVVDQFEELFRFKKESVSQPLAEKSENQEKAENEAAAFVKLLLEAVSDKTRRVYVIITMRSDFLGDCSQFRDLPEAINKGQYLIPRLTSEQLKKAIESPAKVKGARIQPALVARLLNDIGDDQDQLPVLQHALMRTWDEWAKANDKTIEIGSDHYSTTGGMATALSKHADEAFFELGNANIETLTRKQEIAEKLFKCLTETDRENRETRRATTIGKICLIAGARIDEIKEVIETFRQPGRTFLMPLHPEELDENTLIDISHESLIRKWLRLKTWVEKEAQAAQTYRRLAEDAFLNKKGRVGFWSDPELTDALDWKENFKPNETWADLYSNTWGSNFIANYPQAMEFLDKSKLYREKEIAEDEAQRTREIEQERKLREQAEQLALANEREAEKAKKLAKEQQRATELEKQKTEQAQLLVAASERETKAAQALVKEKARLVEIEIEKAITLRKNAAKLRRYIYALAAMSFLLFLVAGFAVYFAIESSKNEETSKLNADTAKKNAEAAKINARRAEENERSAKESANVAANNEIRATQSEANTNIALNKQREATIDAQEQAKIAEEEKKRANSSEAEKQKALETQKELRIEAEEAAKNAKDATKRAEDAAAIATKASNKFERAAEREKIHMTGQLSFETGKYDVALENFQTLLQNFKSENEIEKHKKDEGIWWSQHNIGKSYEGLNNPKEAAKSYEEALETLDKAIAIFPSEPILYQKAVFQVAAKAYTGFADDVVLYKVATMRNLARTYSRQATNFNNYQDSEEMIKKAYEKYDQLNNFINKVKNNDLRYKFDIKLEIAENLYSLGKFRDAENLYKEIVPIYDLLPDNDHLRSIWNRNRLTEILLKQNKFKEAEKQVNSIIVIHRNYLEAKDSNSKFPSHFYDYNIADSYIKLSEIYKQNGEVIAKDIEDQKLSLKKSADEKQLPDNTINEKITELEKSKASIDARKELYLDLGYALRSFSIPSQQNLADAYSKLALSYFNAGKCSEAIEIYKYLLKNLDPQGKYYYEALFKGLVANAQFYQNNLQNQSESDKYYSQLFEIIESNKFAEDVINQDETSNNYLADYITYDLSPLLIEQSKFNLNERILIRLIDILEKQDPKETKNLATASKYGIDNLTLSQYEALLQIASGFEAQGKPDQARKQYEEAIKLIESRQQPNIEPNNDFAGSRLAYVNFRLANLLLNHNNQDKSFKYFQNAIDLFSKYQNTRWEKYPSFIEAYVISLQNQAKKLAISDRLESARLLEQAFFEMDRFKTENIRYYNGIFSKNGIFTPDYFGVKADILESWAQLLDKSAANEKKRQALEARKSEDDARKAQEETNKKIADQKLRALLCEQ